MSKVLIVNSSYRKKSNSSLLSAQVAAGAESKSHEVETIDIGRLQIAPCRCCGGCLQPNSKFCVIKDDMHPLYTKLQSAEVLIYVSPIYWFNVCGQLKQFIDRCFAVAANVDANGVSPFASKNLGAVLVYGDQDPFVSGAVNGIRSFQDICSYTGAKWAGAIYGEAIDEGTIEQNTALLEKARLFGAGL